MQLLGEHGSGRGDQPHWRARDAKTAEVLDEVGHIHLGHPGRPRQRKLAITKQSGSQRRAHPRCLEQTALFEADQQRIGVVAVEHHEGTRFRLAQSFGGIVLQVADAHRLHGPSFLG